MACFKTLTLSGGCVLETCETKAAYMIGTDDSYPYLAYDPDHCYCLATYDSTGFTTTYFGKYDPATNAVIQKVNLGAYSYTRPVYDATAKKFVLLTGTNVILFDPVTETISSFAHTITGYSGTLVYIPQKGKVYGFMGRNGLNELYVGYIDLNLQTIVQLGVLPTDGIWGSQPTVQNWVYVPAVDAIYGAYPFRYIVKFDLATNTASYHFPGASMGRCIFDSNRNLVLTVFGQYTEWDPVTDTAVIGVASGPDFSMRSADLIDSDNLLWGYGRDSTTGDEGVVNINLSTYAWTQHLIDYQYGPLIQFSNKSCIAGVYNIAETQGGLRRLCLP